MYSLLKFASFWPMHLIFLNKNKTLFSHTKCNRVAINYQMFFIGMFSPNLIQRMLEIKLKYRTINDIDIHS